MFLFYLPQSSCLFKAFRYIKSTCISRAMTRFSRQLARFFCSRIYRKYRLEFWSNQLDKKQVDLDDNHVLLPVNVWEIIADMMIFNDMMIFITPSAVYILAIYFFMFFSALCNLWFVWTCECGLHMYFYVRVALTKVESGNIFMFVLPAITMIFTTYHIEQNFFERCLKFVYQFQRIGGFNIHKSFSPS